jgi:hypothetical protein
MEKNLKDVKHTIKVSAGVKRACFFIRASSPSAASIPDFNTIKSQPNNSGF